jgi:hypothetical protein
MADFLETIGDWLGLNKGKATMAAAQQNKGLLDDLGTTGRGIIGGIQGVTGDYLDTAKGGFNAYLDALGLNGAEGSAAARDKFTTSPGYEFGLEQGEQALMRRGSALGRLQSGQTDIDLMRYGVGAANDEWGGYLNRLGDFGNMYSQGVGNDVASRGLGLDFESGLSSAYMGANNQNAAGKEAGQGAMLGALSSIAGIAGNTFGGFGGFGGQKPLGPNTFNSSVTYR